MASEDFDDELEDGEESEDEARKEMHEKMRRVEKKFDLFLDDIAEDVIEPEFVAKIEKKVMKLLRKAGLAPTFTNIKALSVGFDFGMKSTMKLEGQVAQLMIGMHHLVKTKEAKRTKVEIDITKSLPLENEKDGGNKRDKRE